MLKLTPERQAEIEKIADAEIAKFITDIPAIIRRILEGAIASLLGLSNRFGDKWEVDHCNGRRSVIIDIVERKCKESIEELVIPVALVAIAQLKDDKKFLAAITMEVKSTFKQCLENRLRETTIQFANAQAKAVLEGLNAVDLSAIFPRKTELEDPNSFETQIGALILEEIAMRTAKGSKPVVTTRAVEGTKTFIILEEVPNP